MGAEQELLDFIGQPGSIVEYLNSLSYDELGDFAMPLDITLDDGSIAKANLNCYCVQDEHNVFSYVLVLRMR